MFFVAMSIFRFPYALLISVLIGFTALIPIFGAFIGCVIGAFLILIVNPLTALLFILMFVILQQIEGNFIYPHVVGGSIGLPSMWVLVAVTIGGSTMGVAGMLIFIPMFSVIYTLLREATNHRLRLRKISSNKFD
jgi:predicted PurR-regulated permease PerM